MPNQTAPNGSDTLLNSTDPDTDNRSNSNYARPNQIYLFGNIVSAKSSMCDFREQRSVADGAGPDASARWCGALFDYSHYYTYTHCTTKLHSDPRVSRREEVAYGACESTGRTWPRPKAPRIASRSRAGLKSIDVYEYTIATPSCPALSFIVTVTELSFTELKAQ